MGTSLFGLEAELAVSGRKGGAAVAVDKVVGMLMDHARRELPHLCGSGTRMFLGNGSLLYVDAGSHPEVATPECTTPWQVVAHLRSAERMVASLAAAVRKENRLSEIFANRCNVDYLNGSTWGCHESYLARLPLKNYEGWLVPHLASRVYTGSGGLDPLSAGIRFSMSPRVAHIDRVSSQDSTSHRGIFHTRDESLSRSYSRLHILVGDNTCSQLSHLLKIGSTALVVALAERQQKETPPKLVDPLRAMKGFARDIGYRAEVRLPGCTRMMTATEIQRYYIEQIEACSSGAQFPEWTARICWLWRSALDTIERNIADGPQEFDWALKRYLMTREIERSGFSWQALGAWSDGVEELQAQFPTAEMRSGSDDLMRIFHSLASGSEPAGAKARESLAARGLEWNGLGAFAALRQRLCEIDVRFGLVNDGIFDTLDREGMLSGHRVVSEAEIDAAGRDAPMETRASLRGHWVKRLASEQGCYMCSWDTIAGNGTILDLSDPFAVQAEWKTTPPEGDIETPAFFRAMVRPGEGISPVSAIFFAQRNEAYNHYCGGRYAEAEQLLTGLLEQEFDRPGTYCHLARICLLTGQMQRAGEYVQEAWRERGGADPYVVARIIWLQLALEFLEPGEASPTDLPISALASLLLGRLKTALVQADAIQDWNMAAVLQHLAPGLRQDQHALLAALVAAMSNGDAIPALEALEIWQVQAPHPLDGTAEAAVEDTLSRARCRRRMSSRRNI